LGFLVACFGGNRNHLNSRNTNSENRFSFISLESTLGAVSSIVAPLILGWLLVLGDEFNGYSVDHALENHERLGLVSDCFCWRSDHSGESGAGYSKRFNRSGSFRTFGVDCVD